MDMLKFLKKILFGEDRFKKALREKPRYHHYVFTHHFLRAAALAQPREVMQVLTSDDAKSFLSTLLSDLDGQTPDDNSPRDFSADDIILHRCSLKERPCVIIQMPEPKNRLEAFFVAIVASHDLELCAPEAPVPDNPILYFTLEKVAAAYSTPAAHAVFGSWEKKGESHSHSFRGTIANPTLEEFKERIADAILAC
jgi:hypothetical protein